MKILRIFLINIIFISSVYPCADAENIQVYENHSAIYINPGHNDETADNCVACCICACCSIFYTIDNIISLNSYLASTGTPGIIQDKYLINHFAQIWQPPKI
jgi:hypothetical protein